MNRAITSLFFLLCLLSFLPQTVFAENCSPVVARILSLQGQAEVSDGDKWRALAANAEICSGQTLRVGANSRAVVRLIEEQTNVQLAAFSAIRFAPPEDDWSIVEVLKGVVHFISRVPEGLKIRTPYVNAAVEGTEFVVEVTDGESRISVIEGKVALENEVGKGELAGGDTAVASRGKAPQIRRLQVGEAGDIVRWALHYPPVVLPAAGAFAGDAAKAVAAQRAGRLDEALALVSGIDGGSAELHTYRASLLLRRGQVAAAEKDLKRAREQNPRSGDVLALLALIDLVNNRIDSARAKVTEALGNDSRSATVHLTESYVSQREFRLEDALSSSRLATQLAPDNVLALLRTAELQLMLEQVEPALKLLKKAEELAPELAQAPMLEGFALMMNNDFDDAGRAFDKAIGRDDSEPLAHLGRGLVRIRQGELAAGREALETANSLDPRNALVRSYVAKAYYDEGRYAEADKQLELAKDIDRNDPTPWLYDAIVKLATETPLAALDSLQASIRRNDNRAIYRSRLQLDQDRAVRSVNLARIYRAAGDDWSAEREANKALADAPDNYSSHRVLADIYRGKPYHEIAAASEYYQAQLMEPMLMKPVHPQQTETALGVMADLLPGQVSYNDYGGLYARNGLGGGIDFVTGTQGTLGRSAMFYGLGDNFAISGGIMDFDTDGFRDNNDQAIDLGNVLLKGQYGIVTMQLEVKRKRVVKGDPSLAFLGTFSPDLRQDNIVDTVGLGVRHAFSNGDRMLLSYREVDFGTEAVLFPGLITFDTENESTIGELRYDHSGGSNYALAGIWYRENELTADNVIFIPDQYKTSSRNSNYYLYYYPSWGDVDFTFGLARTEVSDNRAIEDETAWNPKLGLGWDISTQIRLRLAAFRVLQRSTSSYDSPEPSLEPVSVQGFVQEKWAATGSELEYYGSALDWQVTDNLATGLELLHRDVDSPIYSRIGASWIRDNWVWQENQLNLHLHWRPTTHWALAAAWQWEFVKAEEGDYVTGGQYDRLTTRKLPVELRWFPQAGLSLFAKATAVHQQGRFTPGAIVEEGKDGFWLLDLKAAWNFQGDNGAMVLSINNVLDEEFSYQEATYTNPTMMPKRQVILQMQLPL